MVEKMQRTLFLIENSEKNRISDYLPGQMWIRLYDKHFPIDKGSIVMVEGTFWVESGYDILTACADGLYKVIKKEKSPRTDMDQDAITLDKLTEQAFAAEFVVLSEKDSY